MSRLGARSNKSPVSVSQLFGDIKNNDVQIFSSSGTWVKPANAKWVTATVLGGGGSAGNGTSGVSFANRSRIDGQSYFVRELPVGLAASPVARTEYVSFPDNVAFRPPVAANIRLTFRISLKRWIDNWSTLATGQTICGAGNHSSAPAGTENFRLTVESSGLLAFRRGGGSPTIAARVFTQTAGGLGQGFNGRTIWLRVTYSANVGGNSQVVFQRADDSTSIPTVWTTMGATVSLAQVTTVNTGTQGFFLMNSQTGSQFTPGRLYRAILEVDPTNSGVWTSEVDADFTSMAAGTTSFTTLGKTGTVSSIGGDNRFYGGAGGSSGYSVAEFEAVNLPDTVSVSVGAGGVGSNTVISPVGVQAVVTSSTNTSGVTTIAGVTVDSDVTKLVLVSGSRPATAAGTNLIQSVTYGGVAFTKVNSVASTVNTVNAEIWYLDNPAVGTADVVVTHPSATSYVTTSSVLVLTNAKAGAPFSSASTSTGAGVGTMTISNLATSMGGLIVSSTALNSTAAITHSFSTGVSFETIRRFSSTGTVLGELPATGGAFHNVSTTQRRYATGIIGNGTSCNITQTYNTTSGAMVAACFESETKNPALGYGGGGVGGTSTFGSYVGCGGATAGNGNMGGNTNSGGSTSTAQSPNLSGATAVAFQTGIISGIAGVGSALASATSDSPTPGVRTSVRPSLLTNMSLNLDGGGQGGGPPSSSPDGTPGHLTGGGGGGAGTSVPDRAGVGGNGGSGLVVVQSWTGDCDIQHFTSNGTWTKPVGDYTSVRVICVAGGGGGGSGRRGATSTARSGGSGGGGGGHAIAQLPYSLVNSTETITVGAGGAGGSAPATDNTDGNQGAKGGDSSFGAVVQAFGGGGGLGGTTAAVLGGHAGSPYGALANTTSVGANAANSLYTAAYGYSCSGLPGGGYSATNNVYTGSGGLANRYFTGLSVPSLGANAVSIFGGGGIYGGLGGGSTSAGSTVNAGNGVDGGGGAGAGAVLNGTNGGNGGNGGDGWVTVVTW